MPYKRRLRALLAKGYFPRELPPVFTTTDFGQHVHDILSDWENAAVYTTKKTGNLPGGAKKSNSYNYQISYAEIEIISKPKRGYERRNIHITHPIPQALLAFELAKNWKTIQKWLLRQTYSLDEIRISDNYERSIKGINFALHRAKKGYLEATSDWLLKTDISRFYPTIYTHSIAWAAYEKKKVKDNLKTYTGSLADRLDLLVRSCNRNQTIGIPVGPETSRILAEVISSRIDNEFDRKMPNIPKDHVDRLQDDWVVGLKTLERAEEVLSAITTIYRDYGLEINGSKTSIEHIIASSGTSWVSEIGAFLSHRDDQIRGARLREFLSLSLRLQSEHPNDSVINYTLSVIESQPITSKDVETLESFLLKAAVISPLSMDRICRIILNAHHTTKRVSAKRIGERFTSLAERNLEKGNVFEVIWQIYTLRGLMIPLNSKKICEHIKTTASSALALILLDMKDKGLCIGSLPTTEWSNLITEERVRSDLIWLLAYEGIRHGWLNDPNGVMAGPFFQAMDSRNVVFYDPTRNVPTLAKVVRERNQFRKSQFAAVQKFIQHLRGFEFGEY